MRQPTIRILGMPTIRANCDKPVYRYLGVILYYRSVNKSCLAAVAHSLTFDAEIVMEHGDISLRIDREVQRLVDNIILRGALTDQTKVVHESVIIFSISEGSGES